jgi:hypothetical protein
VDLSLSAALQAFERLTTAARTTTDSIDRLTAEFDRSLDGLWVTPLVVDWSDEVWPSWDDEPIHPFRRDRNRWTARQYRAECRRWRREHRAWSRRPRKVHVMVTIRASARAVVPDGTVQKFGYVHVMPKDAVVNDPAVLESVYKHIAHKMRAGLARLWEEA